jgi:UDP-glucose 4-epimerase
MRTVVTGGCGFIGTHVVRRLLAAGHEVVVVDQHLGSAVGDVDYRRVDILNLDGLVDAMEGADAVFHLAAMADVDQILNAPLESTRVNVMGTACVLEAARQAEVSRFILASTVWVYGAAPDGEGAIAEEGPLLPTAANHVYTANKLAAEMLVQSYQNLYGLPFTILRYGIPYGPGMRDALVIARFVQQALAGKPLTLAGDGSQYRYYVYVEDLADGHVAALRPEAVNRVIALEGTDPVSIRAIAEAVRDALGEVEITYTPARSGDFAARRVDATNAAELIGWRPTTPFREGLQRYLDWYRHTAGSAELSGPPA